jgi:SAM-dependent methyltransferase
MNDDKRTAAAFANSWTHLPQGSVYTREQFEEWLAPLTRQDVAGKTVLELGCGNASLLMHLTEWQPSQLTGVELGRSVEAARNNMAQTAYKNYSIVQADLTTFRSDGFDVVYCIGVLHHLENPQKGFDSVIANVKSGGHFHCWVYAKEGNAVVIRLVEPLRKIASRLPWWVIKYLIATPLVVPYFFYAKLLWKFAHKAWARSAPLFEYSQWIAQRPFGFFRHVAFDQLVTPRTRYIDKATVESWLSNSKVAPGSAYNILRNGNSWKFGGIVK